MKIICGTIVSLEKIVGIEGIHRIGIFDMKILIFLISLSFFDFLNLFNLIYCLKKIKKKINI